MSVVSLAARWLGLPRPRHRVTSEAHWPSLRDGVRLATVVLRPADTPEPGPTVLLRTARGVRRLAPLSALLVRVLARSGYRVVLQEARGRYDSEGRFVPFVNEGEDGAEALAWVRERAWCNGRVALLGVGYGAYAAWAALARAGTGVDALVVALGARDPYPLFHRGGALALSHVLGWGVGVDERREVPARQLDLARALRFRPLLEADRVALRETPWVREWMRHPRPGPYWEALRADPERPPPALFIAGFGDAAAAAQLADWSWVARRPGAQPQQLIAGPWEAGFVLQGSARRHPVRILRGVVQRTLRFLDRHLRDDAEPQSARVRLFVSGANHWRSADAWPDPRFPAERWYLRADPASAAKAGGTLTREPASGEGPPDRFDYDPRHPAPSASGRWRSRRDPARGRNDVLRYTSEPLAVPLEVAGPARAVLFAASSAPDTDFTARLVDVGPRGVLPLAEGVARARWREGGGEPVWLEPGQPTRFEIELGGIAHRFDAGHALRLEVSSSSWPRFDPNPNTTEDPVLVTRDACVVAQQSLWRDGAHPSHLELRVVPSGATEPPR